MTTSEHQDEEKNDDVNNNDDDDFDGPPIPPDGGWGWVIVMASLMINIIVDGVCFSFGVFYIEFLRYFGESKGKTAWVGSLVPGMYLGMGPLVGALCNKFGCRAVTISGSVIAAISFFLSTFSPSVDVLIVTYGIMGGLGFGLMYLPSIVIVGFYFTKRRAFATGIAVCGSGIGTFLFAPFTRYLMDTYGWKGGNWIISAIILHGIICGATFRPLEQYRRGKIKDEAKKSKSIIMQKIIEEKRRVRNISTGSIDGAYITRDNELITDPEGIKNVQNQLLEKLEKDQKEKAKSSEDVTKKYQTPSLLTVNKPMPSRTVSVDESSNGTSSKLDALRKEHHAKMISSTPDIVISPINMHLEKVRNPVAFRPRSSTVGMGASSDVKKPRWRVTKEASRPLYRQDIFYSGSIKNIAEFKSNPSIHSYVSSVTSIPLPEDDDEDSWKARCMPLISVLQQMFDFSLLRSVTFICLLTTSVLAMTGFFTPFIFLVDKALSLNISINKATFLLSILGLFNTLGRVVSGFISDFAWADCLLIHNVALIIAGVATCCVPFLNNYALLASFCAVFGSCIACFIALRSIVLVELLGIQKLTASFGLLLLFQGLASLFGPPMIGAISDASGNYTLSFIISGVLIALGGIISLPVRKIAKWEAGHSTSQGDAGSAYMSISELNAQVQHHMDQENEQT